MAIPLRDMVIVLPGIMGSRLEDAHGASLWSPGIGMASKLFGRKRWIRALTITGRDDPGDPGLLAGVRPRGLVDSQTIIPGIKRIGGYTELHDALDAAFRLVEGDQHHPRRRLDGKAGPPPNYFRFAYDWRRDNRASALQLKQLIDVALPAWRTVRPTARVILIAHSMGGLVARWYLEAVDPTTGIRLEGWRDVSELITFGTPYRGSLNALQYLVKGYRKLFIDFSDALATFTSMYQLLPRYAAVCDTREPDAPVWTRPRDLLDAGDLDRVRAVDAYEQFHSVIDAGVEIHREMGDYDDRFVAPIIGFGHDTDNSAVLTSQGIELRRDLPTDIVPANWAGGDGTVPLVSALPLEYDGWTKRAPVRFVNKKHGTMQIDAQVLAAEIVKVLAASQQSGGAARALPDEPPAESLKAVSGEPQLGLNLPDHVMAGEPVVGTIIQANMDPGEVVIEMVDVETDQRRTISLDPAPSAEIRLDLPPGEYRVTAHRRPALPGVGLLSAADGLAVVNDGGNIDD